MSVRAVARAETARPPIVMVKNHKKSNFPSHICWRSARAQPRSRPYGAHQPILLTKEILFDYLIASVAQKLAEIEFVENHEKIEKSQISNFSTFLRFFNFL